MSIKRRDGESFEAYKQRQREEATRTWEEAHTVRLLVDSKKALGITQGGIDRAKKRKMLYDMQKSVNANLSNTQRKKMGLPPLPRKQPENRNDIS